MGNRQITLTDTHLLVSDEQGQGHTVINEPTPNIDGFGSKIKRTQEKLYYSLFCLGVGIISLLLIQILRVTGFGGFIADISSTSGIPGAGVISVIFTAFLAGLSLFAVGLIMTTVAMFMLFVWYLYLWRESGQPYLVIHRELRSDYEIKAPSEEEAVSVSTKLDNWFA